MQESDESKSLGGEDLLVGLVNLAKDGDALENGIGRSHCEYVV